jgi:O-antigen/teichoic acid export membrane protein
VGNIVGRLVLLVGVLAIVSNRHDIRRIPILEAGAELAYGFVILAFLARSFGVLLPRVDLAAWWKTIRQSAPLMVNSVARAASYSFDVLVIEIALGPRKLGFYGAGSKPVLFVTSALGLFAVAFLSSFSGQSPAAAEALLRRAVRTALALCLPLAIVISATAVAVVPMVFGHAYTGAAIVLTILAWKIPVVAAALPYGSVLIARDRQVVLMRNNLIAAGLTVAADLIAIPLFGLPGAAVVGVGNALVSSYLNHRSCVRRGFAPALPLVLRGRGAKPAAAPAR